ncbi:MAG: non-homologous end-joining DNA ligase [Candidatus Pacearchaeota archaeon]
MRNGKSINGKGSGTNVMLAEIGSKADLSLKGWIYEPKLDGTRVLVYKNKNRIRLINRRKNDITYRYPELAEIGKNIRAKHCILDAELVVLDKSGKPNFNLLQQREQLDKRFLIELRSKKFPATLFVFDLLEVNGESYVNRRLYERKEKLKALIQDSPYIVLCPYTINGKELWKKVVEQGLEGVMAKRLDSIYEFKRSHEWLKIKNLNTIDAIIVGFTLGSKVRNFGALILAAYKEGKLVYIGRVGTGFDKALLNQLYEMMKKLKTKNSVLDAKEQEKIYKEKPSSEVVWIKPSLIAEVKFLELTRADELRAPSFLRLRFDKKLEDCTL